MKETIIIFSIILSSIAVKATTHIVQVWDGYFQFVSAENFSSDITIQLGDTVQWLPLDFPSIAHTITSTNIPSGAAPFDQIWQAPVDTFFQYVPMFAGLYEYECTPHALNYGMVGSINVIDGISGIDNEALLESDLLVYPNPTTDFIYFNKSSHLYKYRIFSSRGKLELFGSTNEKIDVSGLAKGTYRIEVLGGKSHVMRFLKL